MTPSPILVVDDDPLLLLLLEHKLRCAGHPVATAPDGLAALEAIPIVKPGVLVLDALMPRMDGFEVLRRIKADASLSHLRIIMLTVSEDERDLSAALRAGAGGYLLKTIEGDALGDALCRAMLGESVVANEMTGKLVAAYRQAAGGAAAPAPAVVSVLDQLSPREQDILRGIARGDSNKEIARALGIAETTVKIHVQHVLRKLDVSSRVHAAGIATSNGLV